jgi:hypothetical protein
MMGIEKSSGLNRRVSTIDREKEGSCIWGSDKKTGSSNYGKKQRIS